MEHGSKYLWVHNEADEEEEMEVDYATDMWAQAEQRTSTTNTTTSTITDAFDDFSFAPAPQQQQQQPQSNNRSSSLGGLFNSFFSSNNTSTNTQSNNQTNSIPQPPPKPTPTPAKLKKLRFRQATTNVVSVDLGTLGEEAQIATGDPVYCKKCSALFSSISPLKTEKDNQIWSCEFCGTDNDVQLFPEEIPKTETVDYIIAPPTSSTTTSADESLVIFCIDISGSMGVSYEVQGKFTLKGSEKITKLNQLNTERTATGSFADQWLPHEKRDITYVTRLQCVQAAIDMQLETLARDEPLKNVGIITFNNEVNIFGDGMKSASVVYGDKLSSYDKMFEEGVKYGELKSVKETKKELSKKVFELEENGSTALGPALVAALGMCSKARGSKIVICTDGLSNIGLGSLDDLHTEEEKLNASQFYEQVGLYAKNQGITVSVISIKGSDCSIENLGQLSDLTTGTVMRVDPLNITKDFQTILSLPVIATHVEAKILLHNGLYIRDSENSMEIRNIGNITKETTFTFEYGIRADKKEEFKQLKSLPFQLQISYLKLDGMKCMRSITKTQEITFDQKIAEEKANIQVLSLNAVQQTAKLASKGDYAKARAYNHSNKVMLERTVKSEEDKSTYQKWVSNGRELEDELQNVQQQEISEGLDDLDDSDEVASKETRSKSRKANRNDSTASMLYKFKNFKKF